MKNYIIKVQFDALGVWYYTGMQKSDNYTGPLVGEDIADAARLTRDEAMDISKLHFSDKDYKWSIEKVK